MSDKVILNYNGNELELPVTTGTMDEKSIDISKLRSATGLITMDPGYKNTGACESKITFLDGEEGKLMYRGYPIEQLAEKSSFVEVMYLLIKGELPTQAELDKFIADINEYNYVSEDLIKILDAFPSSAHPMGVLTSLTAALSAFNPKVVDVTSPDDMYKAAVTLLGKFPVLASWTQRKIKGLPVNYSNDKLSYVENFYQLLFKKPGQELDLDPVIIDAIDKLLILHADHEQNCSTSSVRLVGSSHAGLFASISGGISALWGPLHGGANQEVIEMLESIKADGGDVNKFIDYCKNAGILYDTAVESKEAVDSIYESRLAEQKAQVEAKEAAAAAEEKAYWDNVEKTISKGELLGYSIPEQIQCNKDGKKVMLSRKDFLKYVSTPVDSEGNTAYMLDEAKVDSDARMQDDLLKAFLRFTGGDYASLVGMAVNKQKVLSIRTAAAQTTGKRTVIINSKGNNSKTVDNDQLVLN